MLAHRQVYSCTWIRELHTSAESCQELGEVAGPSGIPFG
jgi:hypothetical protein